MVFYELRAREKDAINILKCGAVDIDIDNETRKS